jgi:phage head maturation protease
MTAGYFFPYRRAPYRTNAAAPMIAPRHDQKSTVPRSYDASAHTCDVIAASESPVRERFGLTRLRISPGSLDLSLDDDVPVLNSHDSRHRLGAVLDLRIADQKLYATLLFDQTPAGREAEAMVARGELTGVSCWASVRRWTDEDGDSVPSAKLLNPHFDTWGRDGGPATFTATRWRLGEVSLTTCPRDTAAVIL